MKNPFHKSRSTVLVAGVALVAMLFSVGAHNAKGAGLLVADGGLGGRLEIREHTVEVTINNGVAVTKVKQSFQNMENRQVEALYTFPVPKGASVANFSMWINGKEMVGEVVEKKRAREIYNSYKRVRRDPGLLELMGERMIRARVFPIEPNSDIIVTMNRRPVDSAEDVEDFWSDLEANEDVAIKIMRANRGEWVAVYLAGVVPARNGR